MEGHCDDLEEIKLCQVATKGLSMRLGSGLSHPGEPGEGGCLLFLSAVRKVLGLRVAAEKLQHHSWALVPVSWQPTCRPRAT